MWYAYNEEAAPAAVMELWRKAGGDTAPQRTCNFSRHVRGDREYPSVYIQDCIDKFNRQYRREFERNMEEARRIRSGD